MIEADVYLKHLSRYIHLNPVRAQMVSIPGDYEWSSYCAFIGEKHVAGFLETNKILNQFGTNKTEAFLNYRQFVENAKGAAAENIELKPVGGFLLGKGDFVDWVKAHFLTEKEREQDEALNRLICKVQANI